MISEERLRMLAFQAEHSGYNPQTMARMEKEGKKIGDHGTMVAVTTNELREFLHAYEEKQERESQDAAAQEESGLPNDGT